MALAPAISRRRSKSGLRGAFDILRYRRDSDLQSIPFPFHRKFYAKRGDILRIIAQDVMPIMVAARLRSVKTSIPRRRTCAHRKPRQCPMEKYFTSSIMGFDLRPCLHGEKDGPRTIVTAGSWFTLFDVFLR